MASATPARARSEAAILDSALPGGLPEAPPVLASDRRPVSALVTTHNEAANIAECLNSLSWCDEVVVVDSYSDDGTAEIARGIPGVRVLQRRYLGAASQKNWAIDRLRHDWVLILDADERLTPALKREIEQVLSSPELTGAFSIRRRTYALGKRVRYSGWQNDRVVRLFRRDVARYPNRRVHADMRTLDPPVVLSEPMDHFMVDDLAEYVARIQRYAWWGAGQLWREQRRAGLMEVAFRPLWRFVRTFFLQRGFVEGQRGLVMCGLQAYGVFVKYATLWGWRVNAARGHEPRLPDFDDDSAVWRWPPSTRPCRVVPVAKD